MDQEINMLISIYLMLFFIYIFGLDFVEEFGINIIVNLTWTSRNEGGTDEEST